MKARWVVTVAPEWFLGVVAAEHFITHEQIRQLFAFHLHYHLSTTFSWPSHRHHNRTEELTCSAWTR